MSKRDKIRFIKSVFHYLQQACTDAYEAKDELNFDWYSDAQEAFFQILQDRPIKLSRRVKPIVS